MARKAPTKSLRLIDQSPDLGRGQQSTSTGETSALDGSINVDRTLIFFGGFINVLSDLMLVAMLMANTTITVQMTRISKRSLVNKKLF